MLLWSYHPRNKWLKSNAQKSSSYVCCELLSHCSSLPTKNKKNYAISLIIVRSVTRCTWLSLPVDPWNKHKFREVQSVLHSRHGCKPLPWRIAPTPLHAWYKDSPEQGLKAIPIQCGIQRFYSAQGVSKGWDLKWDTPDGMVEDGHCSIKEKRKGHIHYIWNSKGRQENLWHKHNNSMFFEHWPPNSLSHHPIKIPPLYTVGSQKNVVHYHRTKYKGWFYLTITIADSDFVRLGQMEQKARDHTHVL